MATIVLAIVVTYIWPFINGLVNVSVETMNSMGAFGFFLYGLLNRLLLPFGMHHLLWMPLFYTPLGGTAVIAGESVSGAFNIWLAQLGNLNTITQMDPSIGYLVNFGAMALPIGISLAFVKTARKENRSKVIAIVVPTIIGAIMAGITEPLDFLFLFISPVLWVAHAIVYGLGFVISNIAGINVVVGNMAETLQSLVVPLHLGHQYMIIPVWLLMVAIEYFVFTTLITKLNIPTIGREAMTNDVVGETVLGKRISADDEVGLSILVRGLGGASNILSIENCFTRLRLEVKDENQVDIALLKTYPSSGVVDKKKNVQIIIGMEVETLRDNLDAYVSQLKQEGKTGLDIVTGNVLQDRVSQKHTYNISLYAPTNGDAIPIEDIPDEVFSSKAMGNGFAMKNHNGKVYSPLTGTVMNIFPSLHAISIEGENGEQILIHMGIDTVQLQGKPFKLAVEVGQAVKQGELIAVMDNETIKSAGKDDMVIVVAMGNPTGKLIKSDNVSHIDLVFVN